MKRLLLLLLTLCTLTIHAQTHKLNIRGTVYDNEELQPMEGVQVRLTTPDGRLVAGNATLKNGQYLLPGIPAGTYRMTVKMMGFKEQSFTLTLPQKSGNYKVSDVLLREQATTLTEAVVVGKMSEMTVVDDTVVYNADAFKLPDGALVEELIKKFPGITLDDDNNYVWNGKVVSQILVDGKEFFGNNRDMVLKNLTAEIVDKVKVYDKQSDRARITGIDDGEERTVIDLAIKKNRKRGWFGNIDGAYGTEDRYSGRVNVNRFVGDQKFSIFGNGNNTNGNGMSDNQSLGANMHWQRDKVLELNGSISGNFQQSRSESWRNSQSFENRNAAYSNSHNWNRGHNNSGSFNYKIEWRPDTMTNILIRPELSLRHNTSRSQSESAAFRDDPYLLSADPLTDYLLLADSIGVNHKENANHNTSRDFNVGGSAQYNRRLAKRGRNVTLDVNARYSHTTNESASYSTTDFYQLLATDGGDSTYHKVQYNASPQYNKNVSTRLSYSEPLAQGMYLQMSYQYNYRFTDRDRTVSSIFDWMQDAAGLPYQPFADHGISRSNYRNFEHLAAPDVAQCNYTTNTYQNHNVNLQLRINRTKYQLTVGGNVQPQINTVDYTKGLKHYDVKQSVVNASPNINFRYKFSRNEQYDFKYKGSTGQPGITQLIPDTLSNADPLNISLGNPLLKPSFTHNINTSYRRTNVDHQRTNALNLQWRTTQNATTNRTEYNDVTGGRISKPVNINGNWNGSMDYNFNTALDSAKHWRIATSTRAGMTNSVSYVYRSKDATTVKNRTRGTNIQQTIRLTYRRDWESKWGIEANVNGSFRYNHSRSTNTSASNLDTRTFSYGGSLVLQMPWGMTLSSDINQHSRRGYNDRSMNTNQLIWNASLQQRLLPKKTLTLSLRAVDLLDRRDDINRNVSATSRTDSRQQMVRSYLLFSVNYRFGKYGGKKGGAPASPKEEEPQRRQERDSGHSFDAPRGRGR